MLEYKYIARLILSIVLSLPTYLTIWIMVSQIPEVVYLRLQAVYYLNQLLRKEAFYCNNTRVTEYNINDTYNSSIAYILLYKFVVECLWQEHGGWELIDSHGTGTIVCRLNTGRGIHNETCKVDNVFPPGKLWFASDTEKNCVVVCQVYLDA